MFDLRIECCPTCDGDGHYRVEEFWNVDSRTGEDVGVAWDEPCYFCEGTGGAFVQVWPVECSELNPLVPA